MASTAASARREKDMDEMNQAEIARDETEQKMVYKFIVMVKDAKERNETLDDLLEKLRAMAER